MQERIKMLVYGVTGVGKSVFALGFPKTYFLTTDDNYQYLLPFGADPNAKKQYTSFKSFSDDMDTCDFEGYETLVLDLTEDLLKMCEAEYVSKNKLDHIGDVDYGKGYDTTRTNYLMALTKFINKPKNIILISHESEVKTKDRRGIEKFSYKPSAIIPEEKVLNKISGKLRYVIRAYFEDVDVDGRLMQKRMLSLVPKTNEYGVIRGVDTNTIAEDIPLFYSNFIETINNHKITSIVINQPIEIKQQKETSGVKKSKATKGKLEDETIVANVEKVVETKNETEGLSKQELLKQKLEKLKASKKTKKSEEIIEVIEEDEIEDATVIEEVKETPVKEKVEEKVISREDKVAQIKAKLAAMKKK